jgi:hypothetical protein
LSREGKDAVAVTNEPEPVRQRAAVAARLSGSGEKEPEARNQRAEDEEEWQSSEMPSQKGGIHVCRLPLADRRSEQIDVAVDLPAPRPGNIYF